MPEDLKRLRDSCGHLKLCILNYTHLNTKSEIEREIDEARDSLGNAMEIEDVM